MYEQWKLCAKDTLETIKCGVPYKLSMGYSGNELSMGAKPEASVFRGLTVCTVCGSYASSSGEVGSEVEGPLFP